MSKNAAYACHAWVIRSIALTQPADFVFAVHKYDAFISGGVVSLVVPSVPLPPILINSDDYNRVMLLAERSVDRLPCISAYLERELRRANICDVWDPAGVSMGQRVLFHIDDEACPRLGRLSYPNRSPFERGAVPIIGAIGAALIGMKRNSSIEWLDDDKVRTVKVLDYGW